MHFLVDDTFMGKSKTKPKVIEVSDQEFENIKIGLQKGHLDEQQRKIILAILEIYRWLAQLYRAKGLTLNKLKRLFGFKERRRPQRIKLTRRIRVNHRNPRLV